MLHETKGLFRFSLRRLIIFLSLIAVAICVAVSVFEVIDFQQLKVADRDLKIEFVRTGFNTHRISFEVWKGDARESHSENFMLEKCGRFQLVQFNSNSGIVELGSRAGYTLFIEMSTAEFAVFWHFDPPRRRGNRVRIHKSPSKTWSFWTKLPEAFGND